MSTKKDNSQLSKTWESDIITADSMVPLSVLQARQQHPIFAESLKKCLAIYMRRINASAEQKELFHRFCLQAIKDSEYLLRDEYPPDMAEVMKKEKESRQERHKQLREQIKRQRKRSS